MISKSPDAFRTISEVANWLETPTHVLRFWESRFTQVKPVKRAGGRRYYRPADMLLLGGIKKLLHEDGMTIKGAQKLLREDGIKKVSALSQPIDADDSNIVKQDVEATVTIPEPEVEAPETTPEPKTAAAPPALAETSPEPAPLPGIAARLRTAGASMSISQKEALTPIYARLNALHDRMKAGIDQKQQG